MSFVYNNDHLKNNSTNTFTTKKDTLLISLDRQNKERAFSSSLKVKASLTIEAAIVIPMFMFFVLAIVSFALIISLQLDIQIQMEDTARTLSKKAYYLEKKDMTQEGLNTLTLGASVISGELKSKLDNSRIVGGAGGVNTLLSTYDADTGEIDIVLNYKYSLPFLPDKIAKIALSQRSVSRAWIGRELDEDGADGGTNSDSDSTKVYVTETGSVYHTSKECSYLDLSIRNVDGSEVDSLRNKSGGKYYCCPLCVKNQEASGTVYITDYGENWHTSLGCSGLKRTINEVDLSDVEGMKPCSKCGGSH